MQMSKYSTGKVPPFAVYCCGPQGSGKTLLCCWYALRIKDIIDAEAIYTFSPTLSKRRRSFRLPMELPDGEKIRATSFDSETSPMALFAKRQANDFLVYTDDDLFAFLTLMTERVRETHGRLLLKPRPFVLFLDEGSFARKSEKTVETVVRLLANLRHMGIAVIIATQVGMSHNVLALCNYMMFSGTSDRYTMHHVSKVLNLDKKTIDEIARQPADHFLCISRGTFALRDSEDSVILTPSWGRITRCVDLTNIQGESDNNETYDSRATE